jgi:WD40 repeat protein/tRNA A-37 threonylcarbamoyl transferase component Bud32
MKDRSLSLCGLPPEQFLRVDAMCDRFETEWLAGRRPRIEDYLVAEGAPEYKVLLEQLVVLDAQHRRRAGEVVQPSDYAGRFRGVEAAWLKQELQEAIQVGPPPLPAMTTIQAETISEFERVPDSVSDAAYPTVPGYEILEVLGRGGMGVVYKARDLKLKRVVALKMILSGDHAGRRERDRFKAEAEAVARLQHPNIVQIYEVGEHDGKPFLSLEYCAGGSLNQMLAGTPVAPREAAQLVQTLCGAIHAIHQAQLIHRDLKPANILLQSADSRWQVQKHPTVSDRPAISNLQSLIPKITDFGLAKMLDDAGQTQSGAIVGTASYMAPEQAGGKNKDLGPSADIYALGAILYELLTGRPPFRASTVLDTVMQVVSDEPIPPSQLQRRTPCDLETICLKCLHKQPGRRYASAADLAADLGRYLGGEPILARRVGRVERAAKWVRRNKGLSAVLSIPILALLLGAVAATFYGIAWYFEVREAEEKERDRAERLVYADILERAQREFESKHVEKALALLEECPKRQRNWEHRYLLSRFWGKHDWFEFQRISAAVSNVRFSPDGKQLISVIGIPLIGLPLNSVVVWDVGTGQQVSKLEDPNTLINRACFSPDGKRIASLGGLPPRSGIVAIWDAATGRQILNRQTDVGELADITFSPDGKHLAWAGGDMRNAAVVKIADAATAEDVLDLKGHGNLVRAVCFSPDGQRLASASDDQTVKVWDTSTGREVHTLWGHRTSVTKVCFDPHGRRLASAGQDGAIKVWDVATAREVNSFKMDGVMNEVMDMRFSPDGNRFVAVGGNKVAHLWDAVTGHELLNFTIGNSVSFSPDGNRLAVGFNDTIKVWIARQELFENHLDFRLARARGFIELGLSDRAEADIAQALTLPADDPRPWMAHARFLAQRGDREQAAVFRDKARPLIEPFLAKNADAGNEIINLLLDKTRSDADAALAMKLLGDDPRWCMNHAQLLQRQGDAKLAAEFKDKARTLIGPFLTRNPQLADGLVPRLPALFIPSGHSGPITSVAVSADNRRFLTGGFDNTVRVFDIPNLQYLRHMSGHKDVVWAVAISADGRRALTGSQDKTVRLWDVEENKVLQCFEGHQQVVSSVALFRDGRALSTCWDHTVRCWDAESGKELWRLKFAAPITSLALSKDERSALLGSTDGIVRLWDLDGRKEIRQFPGPTGQIEGLAVSADGQRAVTASYDPDKAVRLFDLTLGKELRRFIGHTDKIDCVAFSPDGRLIASSGMDKTIRLWEIETGREICRFVGHIGRVRSVAFSPDGRQLFSCGFDAGIHMCAVPEPIDYSILPEEALTELTVQRAALAKSGPLAFKDGVIHVQSELTNDDPKDKVRPTSPCRIFTVKLAEGKAYQIDMTSKKIGPYLRLEDAAGKQLAQDRRGGGFFNARIVFRCMADGEYKIIATSVSDDGTGRFDLTLKAPEVKTIALELKDGAAEVQPALVATDVKDLVRIQSVCKIYSVKLKAGKTYQIDMKSKDIDSYLRLEDAVGEQLAEDDDSGGGQDARIIFNCPADGVYRIIATTFGAETGQFLLAIKEM